MNVGRPLPDELQELADAALEGTLTPEALARLEALVLTNPDALAFYADYAHLHASLAWASADPGILAQLRLFPEAAGSSPPRKRRWRQVVAAGAALAACLLMALAGWLLRPDGAVATLVETRSCKWESGELPTMTGAKLVPGRLRLAEGVARLVFTSGAEISLEGPAEVELVSSMYCVLHQGRLVARVPDQASGFVVDTESSRVVDYGTEFGVTVHPPGHGAKVDVQVFSGRVEVLHHATKTTRTLKTGGGGRFTSEGVRDYNPNTDTTQESTQTRPDKEMVHLTTAQGRGRDAFVMPIEIPPDRRSDTLLLIKNSKQPGESWHRKAYLGFDLSGVDVQRLESAELVVTLAPTGMGFASRVGDSVFTLYGLIDETLDNWDEKTIRWNTAPANHPGGAELDPERAVRLGSFTVGQGEQSGTRVVVGPALGVFLSRNTNRLVTLILVRDNAELGTGGLVHGIASRRHPTLQPPTLRLTLGRKP